METTETVDHMTMCADSDSDTLTAVLAYIEEFPDSSEVVRPSSSEDVSFSSSRSSSDDGHALNETATRARTARPSRHVSRKDATHNRARYLQRMELVALRQEEVELRKQLEGLLHARQERTSQLGRGFDLTRHGMLTAWRDVTRRQLQRRKASVEENARLKASVLGQRHVISTLKRIIEQQIRRSNHPLASSRLYSPVWRAVCEDGDPSRMTRIFDELTMDLQQIYSATDAWTRRSASWSLVDGSVVESRIVPVSPTRLSIELVNVRLLPFHFQVVGDVYWNWIVNSLCGVFDFFQEKKQVEGRDTIFCGKAFCNDPTTSHTASLRLRTLAAMQKYGNDNDDQIVCAAATRSETVQVDLEDVPGVHLTEQYWNVFRPPEPTMRDACLMLSFGKVNLEMESGIEKSARTVNAVTEYLQGRMHVHVDHHVETLDDLKKLGCEALALDISASADAVKQVIDKAHGFYGRIDILVNNAGIAFVGTVEEANDQETLTLFDTNVFGHLRVTRAALPYMREKKSGIIANIGSAAGYFAIPINGVYGAAKFALAGITQSLAIEVAHLGIEVTLIEPGMFKTRDMTQLSAFEQSIADYDPLKKAVQQRPTSRPSEGC
ncbi:hypothetical protein Poli38472_007576 [Pythium oligandrum]|uniref:Uncharacterized protein n=1 Tax=Pythium oligandrum TaxID=41045 RepID=A0A8K1FP14_PYTOL|nr:hypothetical protein Poli38472_007576 [Pythium oligandrum]|eukprot:TMW67904.1 hypothetical protein Poli38472_007576 [Pythium oligandrum]